jgi:RNA polymerase sigma factor (sigma-70 family)
MDTVRPDIDENGRGTVGPDEGLGRAVAAFVRLHRSGDDRAMSALASAATPWLIGLARGQGLRRAAAEDVAQTTLLALVVHVDEIRDPACAMGWLAVTARREVARIRRAEGRLVPDDGAAAARLQDPAPGPEHVVLGRIRGDVLRRNVARLPRRSQVLLEVVASGERPGYTRLAADLGMPVGSIGPTRARTLQKIRNLLESDPAWVQEPPQRCA